MIYINEWCFIPQVCCILQTVCSNQSRRNCVFVICMLFENLSYPKFEHMGDVGTQICEGFSIDQLSQDRLYLQTVCSIDQLWQNRLYLQTVCSNQSGRNGAFVICMPLGNKDPRDSFHEKLESLASQEFPTYFCQVQIQTKHFKTKYLTKDIFFTRIAIKVWVF